MDAALVTAFADNAVGRLVQDLIYQGGVDQSHVKWVKFDGVGRTVRNGLNFTERGFGVRALPVARSWSHCRLATAAGRHRLGADLQHRSARFSYGEDLRTLETTPDVAREAMEVARKHGTIISYDLNYRESLWKSIGGQARAVGVNRELAPLVDVMIGNERLYCGSRFRS